MNVGDIVKIIKCDICSNIVGKTAKIMCFTSESGYKAVRLNFGRGRPAINRPSFFGISDISLVETE